MADRHCDEIPYSTCKVASLVRKSMFDFFGLLEVSGAQYSVYIYRNEKSGEQIFVRADVILSVLTHTDFIDHFAMAVAEKASSDEAWSNVKVDLSTGGTRFVRSWTHDFPNDRGIDAFLSEAAVFIEEHIDELHCLESLQYPTANEIEGIYSLFLQPNSANTR